MGANSPKDVALLERRHVLPLVLALHDSSVASAVDKQYCVKLVRTIATIEDDIDDDDDDGDNSNTNAEGHNNGSKAPGCHNYMARCGTYAWLADGCTKAADPASFAALAQIAASLARQYTRALTERGGRATVVNVDAELWDLAEGKPWGDRYVRSCLFGADGRSCVQV